MIKKMMLVSFFAAMALLNGNTKPACAESSCLAIVQTVVMVAQAPTWRVEKKPLEMRFRYAPVNGEKKVRAKVYGEKNTFYTGTITRERLDPELFGLHLKADDKSGGVLRLSLKKLPNSSQFRGHIDTIEGGIDGQLDIRGVVMGGTETCN